MNPTSNKVKPKPYLSNRALTFIVKYIEQQNENRILLKKMLSIDLKPSTLGPNTMAKKQPPTSASLNRVQRLRELVRVNEENKVNYSIIFKMLLSRLQNASSVYDHKRWVRDTSSNNYLIDMIRKNSGIPYTNAQVDIAIHTSCSLR